LLQSPDAIITRKMPHGYTSESRTRDRERQNISSDPRAHPQVTPALYEILYYM